MQLFENIKMALESIRTNKMRSFLTMLGIIIGIASVIIVVSVGNGATNEILGLFEQIGANTLQVKVSSDASDSDQITMEDIEAIKEKITTVKYASTLRYQMGKLETPRSSALLMVMYGSPDIQYVVNTTFVSGRFFTEEEYARGASVAVISESSAKELFGSVDCVGQSVDAIVNGMRRAVTIVGVSADQANTGEMASIGSAMGMDTQSVASLVMPVTAMISESDSSSGSLYYSMQQTVYLVVDTQEHMDEASASVVALLEARHGNRGREVYRVSNFLNMLGMVETMMELMTTFIAAVAAISLLVGGIGVMNIMLVSVTERTREIGIRKALGARTGAIMLQFLIESAIITLIGGAIGLTLGVAGSYGIGNLLGVSPSIGLSTIVVALLFSAAVGTFFGIYPARKAARMRPIEALRRD